MQIRRLRRKPRFSVRFSPKLVAVILIFLILGFIAIPLTIRSVVVSHFQDRIYQDVDDVAETRIAIVFGAGLTEYATEPSAVLEDRILTAVDLYKAGKVKKIIMSGDNRFEDYNEPQVMINFAKAHGVSELDLQPDYGGRRTYDTCYRAREIFGVRRAILVTQEFHLPRALYTCSVLGIDSVGIVADKRLYENIDFFQIRDSLALTLAFWELFVQEPEVVLGEKISI